MQSALDATALMLSREAPSLSEAQLAQKAASYFAAAFNRPELRNLRVVPTLTSSQSSSYKLEIVGSGSLDTTLTRVLGHPEIAIGATAEVAWGLRRLELALALDNTGSMAWNAKMVELKKAVHSLLDTLQASAKRPDDVRVAVVPFDTSVRIGPSYKDEPWVDFDANDVRKATWRGCVEDRDQPNDVRDTAPAGPPSYFPAVDCSNNGALAQLMPLTNDWDALRRRVNQMNPNGMTNVTIGLAWAWHALSPALPLTEALPASPEVDKVIVLLTDGDNTRNRWTGRQSAIDARTAAACANIKAANIRLYTVRVIEGNASLLRDCATDSSHYYNVQQAAELNTVFKSIAQTLANLRVSK
jgi:Mg-chelatase subunit ChlD